MGGFAVQGGAEEVVDCGVEVFGEVVEDVYDVAVDVADFADTVQYI